ncbi:MAG: Sua5/YciO/YrdC/YwlC family protein [Candidatus Saccharibacteria bacterium]|nr:Sua5/YciO/YrdC/YwlC family protein [Candidatus Saccharibacteria bacterium]
MYIISDILDTRVIRALRAGDSVVARTDTIYGVLALATLPEAMQRLYRIKHRDALKSCIVLTTPASAIPGLRTDQLLRYSQLYQARPTTVVTEAADILPHLPHQQGTLAFRAVPPDSALAQLIRQVGPLLAPSANPAGQPPARTVRQALKYFGDMIPVYVDGGTVTDAVPSRIIRFNGDDMITIRD